MRASVETSDEETVAASMPGLAGGPVNLVADRNERLENRPRGRADAGDEDDYPRDCVKNRLGVRPERAEIALDRLRRRGGHSRGGHSRAMRHKGCIYLLTHLFKRV